MKAEIINVGNEVLLGNILNENARYLSEKLASIGFELLCHKVVGDQAQNISQAFQEAWNRAQLIIFTGGLGATVDDLTKEVVTSQLGLPLEKNSLWEDHLKAIYKKVGIGLDEKRKKQALVPRGCTIIPNDNGTAPGVIIEREDKIIILLPGPPEEVKPMVEKSVLSYLKGKSPWNVIKTHVLKVIGLGEATLEDRIRDLIDIEGNPRVVLMAQPTETHVYVTVKGMDKDDVDSILKEWEGKIRDRLGFYLYGVNEETLEGVVANLLFEGNYTVSTAESCTGGLLADKLTDIPGSSNYFLRGIVCYSNQAKMELLQVPREILDSVGAVSEETARAMVENIRSSSSSHFSLSTTGYAGPSDDPDDPVGLVYIGLGTPQGSYCQKFNYWGNRRSVKEQAAVSALNLLRLYLEGHLQ
ncbi:MAG: competence/damage-inducible protein A [Candidatus Syntrophonatronum acetioxidans]|uniref:Putative competence-damage inducible protein n=1 Tax=Candidatus Syntrophonatronum acetioxidans TaxID=1795816 RepID=A0A424YDB4_9FIRM|nr:MAG: competence/damage-inducible protein A [Candidatus Syntrophonatronum acetioxidans]